MAARVVLVSTSFAEQEGLEDIHGIHNSGQFTFETTASFAQDSSFWAAVDVLILNVPDDTMIQAAFLEKLKAQVGTNVRVMILTPQINPQLIQVSHQFPKVRLIKQPVSSYMLYRSLVDLSTDYPLGQQQVHPRFMTDLEVPVVSDLKSVKLISRVKNLSVSGAYFEVNETTATLAKGDLVRLTIGFPQSKSYELDAKVVWSKLMPEAQAIGYGCAFLNKEQVYDQLLAQVGR